MYLLYSRSKFTMRYLIINIFIFYIYCKNLQYRPILFKCLKNNYIKLIFVFGFPCMIASSFLIDFKSIKFQLICLPRITDSFKFPFNSIVLQVLRTRTPTKYESSSVCSFLVKVTWLVVAFIRGRHWWVYVWIAAVVTGDCLSCRVWHDGIYFLCVILSLEGGDMAWEVK